MITTSMWTVESSGQRHLVVCEVHDDRSDAVEAAFVELHGLVNKDPRSSYIIDAASITRISSLAIAQLIATVRSVDMSGGRIVMIHAHPFVANVLRTMRIVRVLPLFNDLDGAESHLEHYG